jgi:hypothetical protein
MASCHAANRCESAAASTVPIPDPINMYGFMVTLSFSFWSPIDWIGAGTADGFRRPAGRRRRCPGQRRDRDSGKEETPRGDGAFGAAVILEGSEPEVQQVGHDNVNARLSVRNSCLEARSDRVVRSPWSEAPFDSRWISV